MIGLSHTTSQRAHGLRGSAQKHAPTLARHASRSSMGDHERALTKDDVDRAYHDERGEVFAFADRMHSHHRAAATADVLATVSSATVRCRCCPLLVLVLLLRRLVVVLLVLVLLLVLRRRLVLVLLLLELFM